jgi:hypothetical protein
MEIHTIHTNAIPQLRIPQYLARVRDGEGRPAASLLGIIVLFKLRDGFRDGSRQSVMLRQRRGDRG